jgi:hypothetical protein
MVIVRGQFTLSIVMEFKTTVFINLLNILLDLWFSQWWIWRDIILWHVMPSTKIFHRTVLLHL